MTEAAGREWWDGVSGDNLEQGHLLCGIVHPLMKRDQLLKLTEPSLKANVTFQKINGILLTQTCDLEHKDLTRAVVVRAVPIAEARERNGFTSDGFQEIRDGRRPLFTLLAGPDDPTDPEKCILVDFRWVLSLPLEYLKAVAAAMGNRPALRSPYIEHLSSAFARCFARVALPTELPSFTPAKQ